jgi:hypothetical protein
VVVDSNRDFEFVQCLTGPQYITQKWESTVTFEPGDFEWNAHDLEFLLKLGFYSHIMFGVWTTNTLPLWFVQFVRRHLDNGNIWKSKPKTASPC